MYLATSKSRSVGHEVAAVETLEIESLRNTEVDTAASTATRFSNRLLQSIAERHDISQSSLAQPEINVPNERVN